MKFRGIFVKFGLSIDFMRNIVKIVLWVTGFWCGICTAPAQEIRARVIGLETDSLYMALLREEYQLKIQEDSLLDVIRSERQQLSRDTTNLRDRSRKILGMEETVFELRNHLGGVASKINGIEQEFILGNLFASGTSHTLPAQSPSSNYANLIDNDYFRENLSPEEYRELKSGDTDNSELRSLIEEYKSSYERLEALSAAYADVLTQAASDSVYSLCRDELAAIRKTEAGFEAKWGDRYSQEVYLYSYLLDKLNRMDDLAALNEKARARRTANAGEVMSVAFAEYPAQREILVDYELALAGALNLLAATDSLNRVRRTIAGENLAFPEIKLEEKEFVQYQDVSFPDVIPYNTENPIPEIWIPESGTYYSVTVGSFSQRQSVSVFRGAVPVAYERLRSGQWRYYVGLFRSYGDAVEAVDELKNAGFRRPEAVRWKDGVYENLSSQASQNAGFWRIAIETEDNYLPEEVRFQLSRYARNKEVTRVGNLFYVGTFTDKLHLEDVIQVLDKIPGIEVKVEELEE